MSLRAFIGHDARQPGACRVAAHSLRTTSGLRPEWLVFDRLRDVGLLTRPLDRRDGIYDLISNAPASTDFAISRFLVPVLCQSGWALFTDCDMLFLRDVHEMLFVADTRYAVMVVKHPDYTPSEKLKMDGQPQTAYARKNWSSVMLWNCDHPANRRLSLADVNRRTGLWLHGFGWLADSEIGELEPAWNWLVNVAPMPHNPGIAHYTLGVPSMPGYEKTAHAELWWRAHATLSREE